MLRTVLTPLLGTTTFGGMALDALTYVALGGLYGASLYIARAADPKTARADVDRVLGPASSRFGHRRTRDGRADAAPPKRGSSAYEVDAGSDVREQQRCGGHR